MPEWHRLAHELFLVHLMKGYRAGAEVEYNEKRPIR